VPQGVKDGATCSYCLSARNQFYAPRKLPIPAPAAVKTGACATEGDACQFLNWQSLYGLVDSVNQLGVMPLNRIGGKVVS
jgi:hypothetical protein